MPRTIICVCLGLLALCGLAYSQTTFATITGTVTDSSGAVVPNALVSATNVDTGIKVETRSNETGNYTIPQLREGNYTVRAQAAGFKEFVAQNVSLVARDIRRVDVTFEVGTVGTSVEVSAGATLIETETARISDTKQALQLKALPLNTRGMWAFLALAPTVLQAAGSSTIRFAGSKGNQSHWAIDGTTMSDGVDETQIGPLANYIESFQELKVDMSNNTAEFGTIGQVTIVSKSGTNALHGSLFDYYSTPWFRARNPFATARGTGISHTPGGSIGGPVVIPKIYNGRNRTFFFFSFETSRGSTQTDVLNPTVPLAAWRRGDFSNLTDSNGKPIIIKDPRTGQPFANNVIPAERINPVSQKIQDMFYPLPNYGNTNVLSSRNYLENKTRPWDPSTYWVPRIDHRISDKDSLFGRYTWHRLYYRAYEGNLPSIGRRNQQRDNRGATVSWTHTFNPTMVNEFRWGFALNNNPIEGPVNGPTLVKELGLVGLAPDLPNISGILKVNWSGLGLQNIAQYDYTRPGYRNHLEDFQEHVSWFRDRHAFKFGFNLSRVEYDSLSANPNLFGSVTFSNRFTGFPYADFLLGIPTTSARAFPPVEVDRNRWQYDFFAIDDFKVTPQLTLNLGVRYELHMPWRENHNMLSLFDIGTSSVVVPDAGLSSVSKLFPTGFLPVVGASKVGLPQTLLRADKNNIAPRVGLAYRPWGNNTVFRAGYGLFYDVVPRLVNSGGIPFVLNEPDYTNPVDNPDVILPRIFPSTGTGGPSSTGVPAAVNPDIRMPYSMQYNVTIEHQRWDTGFRISYIGTNTRQSDYAYNINAPIPDARPYVDKPRRWPQYTGISYFTNGAGHQYNALTVEAQRNMLKGLYFQTSWTWARDIYDLDRGQAPENPYDRERERAVAMDVPTHRFNANWTYMLPFGRGRKWVNTSRLADAIVGGWELNGIYSYYSNQFLTALWTGPDPVGIAYTSSRTPALVTIRPDQLRDPNLPQDQRSIYRWFDVGAFAAPPVGRFGTAAKGTIKGPGVNVWHMGVAKEYPFKENGPRLRAELTATNIFNHPNWSNPATNISQTQAVGYITSVGGVNGASTGDQPAQRAFRAGIRLEW